MYYLRANGFYITRLANLQGERRNILRCYGYQGAAFKSLLAGHDNILILHDNIKR